MRRISIRVVSPLVGIILASISPPGATAGPAKYDPKTRSFSLTYTYASLPHFGMTPDQVETLGTPQAPGPGQDENVRALHQAVSQVIFEITGGRAKIGSFDHVQSIKTADIVISLTGNFNRAGWAISGAIEGRPGQVGLYYLYLASPERSKQDVVLTASHELGHYLFSLPDEYSNTDPTAASCPLKNPGGPGCLMDNYMTRHGYLALCTDDDHNADGPGQNPGTIVSGSSAELSCKALVERFFRAHPPEPAGVPGGAGEAPPAEAYPARAGDNPFGGPFRRLVESSISFVREQAAADEEDARKKGKKAQPRSTVAASSAELSALRRSAESYLEEQLAAMRNDGDFVAPTADQVRRAIDFIARQAAEQGVRRPPSIDRKVAKLLQDKAREFASRAPGGAGRPSDASGLLRLLFNDPAGAEKSLEPIVEKVKKDLVGFLLAYGRRARSGSSQGPGNLSAEERRYVEKVAREAVTGTGDPSGLGTFTEAARLHIQLTLEAAQTLNALASEINVPGAERRRLDLAGLREKLAPYALPGRPYTGFGSRRTFIVAPHPISPEYDFLPIDAGEKIPYHEIRNLAVSQFMSLIQRERTVVLNDPLTPPPAGALRAPGTLGANDLGAPPAGFTSDQRFAYQAQLINRLAEEIRGDRAENIIILAPPGGLTQQTGESLEVLRRRVLDNPGVRVDLVTLGGWPVPLRLRDLVHRSGGTVQSAIDIDETGMISQRLQNDLATGSWVALPQQGYIDLSPEKVTKRAHTSRREGQPKLSLDELQERYSSRRADPLKPILKIATGDIDEFIGRITYLLERYPKSPEFLPSSYDTNIKATLTDLYGISRKLLSIDKAIVGLESPGATILDRLDALGGEIVAAKTGLRAILKAGDLFGSPLTNTDDYLDYALRARLLQRARNLSIGATDPNGEYAGLAAEFRSRVLQKAAFLCRRATERDQLLADVQQAVYQNQIEIRRLEGGIPPKPEVIAGLKANNKKLAEMEEDLERSAVSSTPTAPRDLLSAAKSLEAAVNLLSNDRDNDRGATATVDSILNALERQASLLERASRLEADRDGFAERLAAFRRQFTGFRTAYELLRAPADAGPDADAGEPDLKEKKARDAATAQRIAHLASGLRLLTDRSEHQIGAAGAAAPQGSWDPASPESSQANALSPLNESLKSTREIQKKAPTISEIDRVLAENPGDRFSLLRTAYAVKGQSQDRQKENFARIVEYYADDLAHGDFPRLLLDTLGHLRMLEDDLAGAKERIFTMREWRSPSERLGERRELAQVELNPFRDGQSIRVTFSPFQTERDAYYEIVLGLSRPLRDFEGLKKDPPRLVLYRDGKPEEKPYLNFIKEDSTQTMLIFRAPTPRMKAGVLGEGLFTPKLLMKRKFFPVVGQDNTIAYTFTVATPRPNVQLIAALSQPRPEPGPGDGAAPPGDDAEGAYRGTIPANLNEAIIEVQVIAGASVRNAEVTGYYHRLELNDDQPIDKPGLAFADDGIAPDRTKDDGVYTARVTLLPPTRRRSAEYRVFIEARPGKDVRFIPLAEALPRKEGTEKADLNTTPPPVPPFQRATSLNFRVAGEG